MKNRHQHPAGPGFALVLGLVITGLSLFLRFNDLPGTWQEDLRLWSLTGLGVSLWTLGHVLLGRISLPIVLCVALSFVPVLGLIALLLLRSRATRAELAAFSESAARLRRPLGAQRALY